MPKKGQAAMEFLLNYGWVFLAIALVIGVLTYLGILNPSMLVPESCQFALPLTCISQAASDDGLIVTLQNRGQHDIILTQLKATSEALPSGCQTNLPPGGVLLDREQQQTITISGNCQYQDNNRGKNKYELQAIYMTVGTTLNQIATGEARINYQKAESGGGVEKMCNDAGPECVSGFDTTTYETCKELRDANPYLGDGTYTISPGSSPLQVFCDMTTDEGGWTALAANGDISIGETTDAGDCYPLISDTTAGCKEGGAEGNFGNIMSDFSLPGSAQGAISWQHLLAVAYGDGGYSSNKLAYFAIDFGITELTTESRTGGTRYISSTLSSSGVSDIYCSTGSTQNYMISYAKQGDTAPNPPTPGIAGGRGTIFGTTADMVAGRRTFGFTDRANLGTNLQLKGLDDYQDGWSCNDNWSPKEEVRGQRMAVLVR